MGISAKTEFSKSFESAPQTIVAGGLNTIAHGLGVVPKLVKMSIICTTAEGGYAIGEEIKIEVDASNASGQNAVYKTDATNIYVSVGNSAAPLKSLNYTTGASLTFTTNRWQMILRAWA